MKGDIMPPIKKIDREYIITAALDILNNEGIEFINARKLASKLNCSVQPIFYNFKSMVDLKSEVLARIYEIYKKYMNAGKSHKKPYKGMGLAYIKFARDYPNYFKCIFMGETNLSPISFITNDDAGNDVIKSGMEATGLSYEEQKEFHLAVWIFTHGLASLVATKTVILNDEDIDFLLESTVKKMIIGKKVLDNEKCN